jgi:hypothetical protein
MNESSLSKIESIVLKKLQGKDEDSLTSVPSQHDIWLRKRVIKSISTNCNINWESLNDSIAKYQVNDVKCSSKYFYHRLSWQRQVGPCCGLAALSMVHKYLNGAYKIENNNEPYGLADIDEFLDYALLQRYTSDGEIFDINHLVAISNNFAVINNVSGEVKDIAGVTMLSLAHFIITALRENMLITFAYDRDDLGSLPCQKAGMKAHYVAIIGYVKYYSSREESLVESNEELIVNDDISGTDLNSLQLIGVHSLSNRPVVAPLVDWIASNGQLECDSKYFPQQWIVNSDGYVPNLSNKIAIFSKLKIQD